MTYFDSGRSIVLLLYDYFLSEKCQPVDLINSMLLSSSSNSNKVMDGDLRCWPGEWQFTMKDLLKSLESALGCTEMLFLKISYSSISLPNSTLFCYLLSTPLLIVGDMITRLIIPQTIFILYTHKSTRDKW